MSWVSTCSTCGHVGDDFVGKMCPVCTIIAAKDAEIASLKAELANTQHEVKRREHIKIKDDRHFERMQATQDRLIADLAALRAVVMGLPEYQHWRNCDGLYPYFCNCGADIANAALAAARNLSEGESK